MDGRRASGDAGRPHELPGPGFLEIVSGPGPLNALYVSCNLIPRRSARCPDLRVIYANSWASGSVRAAGPPGSPSSCIKRPMRPPSLRFRCRGIIPTLVAPYVDDHHQEDGVRSVVSPIPRVNECKFLSDAGHDAS